MTLNKSEIFHLVIFAGVFLYFSVLKITGNLEIDWLVMLLPLAVGSILYIIVKILKKVCKNKI